MLMGWDSWREEANRKMVRVVEIADVQEGHHESIQAFLNQT